MALNVSMIAVYSPLGAHYMASSYDNFFSSCLLLCEIANAWVETPWIIVACSIFDGLIGERLLI